MKPLLTPSTTIEHASDQVGTVEVLSHPVSIGDCGAGRAQVGPGHAHLTLTSEPLWSHKLILTGSLDHRTAAELEDEIECLCEEGVTTLTLDLRRLGVIDSVGAKAIASRGAVCKQRGRDFAVIPGSPVVHRALAEAGAESLLAGDPSQTDALRRAVIASASSSQDTSTAMIKSL